MRAALVTEYRKLVTTRLWWVLLAVMAAYMLFLGAVLAVALTMAGSPGTTTDLDVSALDPRTIATSLYTLAPTLGYVFPVLVGALSVTGEVRHRTLTPTFLAEPRRGLVLTAKLVSSALVGLLFGLVGTVSAAGAGAAVLAVQGDPTFLGEAATLRTLALSVLALALWCCVGVGFGSVLTNQVAAVVVLLAFTQFVEPLLRMLLASVEGLAGVAPYLPGAAGEAITGGSFYSAAGFSDLLAPGQGLAVLAAYGLVLAVVGRFTTLRRDIT